MDDVSQLCFNAWQLNLIVWLTGVCLDDGRPTFRPWRGSVWPRDSSIFWRPVPIIAYKRHILVYRSFPYCINNAIGPRGLHLMYPYKTLDVKLQSMPWNTSFNARDDTETMIIDWTDKWLYWTVTRAMAHIDSHQYLPQQLTPFCRWSMLGRHNPGRQWQCML